jgi:ubiquinone/menaquinone biosynthesis C-methylase UbiE
MTEKNKYDFLYSNENTPAQKGKYGDGNHRVEWLKNNDINANRFLELINLNDNILDIGCGTGGVLAYLSNINSSNTKNFFGIDISEIAINKGLQEYNEIDNIKLYQGDATDIKNFNKNYFDLVYSLDFFEHIPKNLELKVLNEMIRLSKKYIYSRICIKKETKQDEILLNNGFDYAHINIKSPEEWLKLLLKNNKNFNLIVFEVEKDYINFLLKIKDIK